MILTFYVRIRAWRRFSTISCLRLRPPANGSTCVTIRSSLKAGRSKAASFLRLLELLKATALEKQYRHARPKRLRLAIFTQLGSIVHHARKVFMRIVRRALTFVIRPGRYRLARLQWDSC